MVIRNFILKITAVVMMAVFALSITPTIVFHNWLANHADTYTKAQGKKGEQLGKQTFNCHCDDIVAESPFTEPCNTIITYALQPVTSAKVKLRVRFISSKQLNCSQRGPPTV